MADTDGDKDALAAGSGCDPLAATTLYVHCMFCHFLLQLLKQLTFSNLLFKSTGRSFTAEGVMSDSSGDETAGRDCDRGGSSVAQKGGSERGTKAGIGQASGFYGQKILGRLTVEGCG